MELDASKFTKFGIFAAILVVFAVAAWRLGAPDDFNKLLADAGLAQPAPVAAPAPAPQPIAPDAQPAQTPAPAPAPAPTSPQGDASGTGH